MNYEIGEKLGTKDGTAICTTHNEGKAVFTLPDGSTFEMGYIEQVKSPAKKRYSSSPMPTIKPTTEAQISDLDKLIAEAEAKKAALGIK